MKKLLTYGFNEIFCKGLNVSLVFLLPLFLPKEQFGIVVYFIAIEQVIVAIIAFGQQNYFLKQYQKSSNVKDKEQVFTTSRVVCKFIAMISLVVLFLLDSTTDSLDYKLVYYVLVIFACYFIVIYEMTNIKFRADGNDLLYFKSKITYQVIKFSVCLILVYILDFGFESYLISILFSSVFVTIINNINNGCKFFGSAALYLPERRSFIVLLPFALQSILNILHSVVDRLMVKDILNNEELALYGFSYNIASLAFFVISVVFLVYLPKFYKIINVDLAKSYLKQGCIVSSVFVFLFMFFVYIGYDFLDILYDDEYIASSTTTLILIGSYFFHIGYLYFFHMSNLLDSMKGLPIVVILTLITNISLNYFMIPSYGIEGAAISTLISELLLVFLMGINLKMVNYHDT